MKDFKAAIAKPRTVALYASMTSDDWYTIMEVRYLNYDEHYQPLPDGQTREQTYDNYVRISEPVEIAFASIASDEVVAKAIESLNESERQLLAEMNKKLAELRERKSQLLALTVQS